MSYFDPRMRIRKTEKVDFIVPERIREARRARGLELEDAAERLGISKQKLGCIENGHIEEIPLEFLFKAMSVYDMPRGFFYRVVWERI